MTGNSESIATLSEREFLTVKQTAKYLNVSASIVYRLCETGKLSHYRFGEGRGAIRVKRIDLNEFVEQCKVEKRAEEEDTVMRPQRDRPLTHVVFTHLNLDRRPLHPCGALTRAGTPCTLLTREQHCHLHSKK